MSPMTLAQMKVLYKKAKKAYYETGDPIMSDAKFDKLEETIKDLDPRWKELHKTGVRVGKKVEVKLSYPMPSLLKVTDDDDAGLLRWIKALEGHVTLTPKFDGCSVQVDYENGEPVRLRTRGDGTLGKDISYFIQHTRLPRKIKMRSPFSVRMEAIFPVSVYERKWSKEFKAARNAASGLLNRQDVHRALEDLHFIALRLQVSKLGQHSQDLLSLERLGFEVPSMKMLVDASRLNAESLRKTLERFKTKVNYELDGVVVHSDKANLRHEKDKPDYAFAWKLNDLENAATATVKRILWNVSPHGVIVPKAELEPIRVQGALIKFATCNNAKWASERGLGPGAQVKLIRSGEIIPKIVDVLKRTKCPPPDARIVGAYKWDDHKTHLVLDKPNANASVKAKQLDRFFKKMGVEFLAEGTTKKMVSAGYDTIEKAIRMTKRDFLKLESFGEKAAERAVNELQSKLSAELDLAHLMVASNLFDRGMGTRRLAQIAEHDPRLLYDSKGVSPSDLYEAISQIKGMPDFIARNYSDEVQKFWRFCERTGLRVKPHKRERTVKGPLSGMGFTWTGYRNKEEEAWIASLGGTVVAFGSKTNVLFVTATGKASSKADKAKEKGIKVMDFRKFKAKY